MKKISVLGSTGSIGTQCLDIIRYNKDIEVVALAAGSNIGLLKEQIKEFAPKYVSVSDEKLCLELKKELNDESLDIGFGKEGLIAAASYDDADIVLSAVVGMIGIEPTIAAIKSGKDIALANKETIVCAGHIIMQLVKDHGVNLFPVDSEHSAIFQCLTGSGNNPVEALLLTASGGPFRQMDAAALTRVTAAQALKHPNWVMGAKITIDSASMMNKGFEMIEAKWLFGVQPEAIEIVVHPESIIHSAVRYADGAVIAQMGLPDMHLPISYAFSYPRRLPISGERMDLFRLGSLHFERPDVERFSCLRLAYAAVNRGGNAPCVLNAANEVVNLAFREGRIAFPQMAEIINETMARTHYINTPTLDDYFETDSEARRIAASLIPNT